MVEYLRPYEGMARHVSMNWHKPLVAYGNPTNADLAEKQLADAMVEYQQRLLELMNNKPKKFFASKAAEPSALERIWVLFIGHSYYFSSFCFLSASFLCLLQSNSPLYDFISKENLLDINPKILQNSNELSSIR